MLDLFRDSSASPCNAGWIFLPPPLAGSATLDAIPPEAQVVTLPHAWNDLGWSYGPWSTPAPKGTGWYYKQLPAGTPAGAVLKFEGVSAECAVYLNGRQLATNLGAHRVFEVALEGLRGDGSDIIAVRVTDKDTIALLAEGCDPVFAASPRFQRWAVPRGSSVGAGGIWREVWLLARGASFMRAPVVRNVDGRFTVLPEVSGGEGLRVRCVLSLDGVEVVRSEVAATAASLTLDVPGHRPWLPLRPVLYRLETTLVDAAGKTVQTITQPAAFFDLTVRDSGFVLNGRPYFLRGQNGFPHCNVPHDRAYIARYVTKVREQGVEISRFHTEPPSHAWLDECDRQGIMVIFEMALHGSVACYPYGSQTFQETALAEFRSLVLEFRRHPCIAMWCLGNEMIVSCERDIGLGKPLFAVLAAWIEALRPLDHRPIVANSGGDAADTEHRTVGDVDDIHQYGGWYVENIRELRGLEAYTRKNDMLFQPCISTESIAAYTNDDGECFLKHGDVRQRKVIAMRFGKVTDLAEQSQRYQCFLLKEYAEAMWRLRRSDSTFAGYIPFGQYTWFSKPFADGPDGLREKRIWQTYRMVMGPVHVQLECWDRNLDAGGSLDGVVHLLHESLALPEKAVFQVGIRCGDTQLSAREVEVAYHDRADFAVRVGPFPTAGSHQLTIEVRVAGAVVAYNQLDIRVCSQPAAPACRRQLAVYDPAGVLRGGLERIGAGQALRLRHVEDVLALDPQRTILLVAPHALDREAVFHAAALRRWLERGGRAIVLEQNPGPWCEDVFGAGIGFVRSTQPHWSRWASNLVKHADRSDLVVPGHPVFAGLVEDDLRWWNRDTYVANAYLQVKTASSADTVLSRIGNGLGSDELMPVQYDYVEPGFSITLMQRGLGAGSLMLSSLLIGGKADCDPLARRMLVNLLRHADA